MMNECLPKHHFTIEHPVHIQGGHLLTLTNKCFAAVSPRKSPFWLYLILKNSEIRTFAPLAAFGKMGSLPTSDAMQHLMI